MQKTNTNAGMSVVQLSVQRVMSSCCGYFVSQLYHCRVCDSLSFTVMRRMFERYTRARLCFSGAPHAPVNMAYTFVVCTMSAVGLFVDPKRQWKSWRTPGFGVRNIEQYSAANVRFLRFFYQCSLLLIPSAIFTGACGQRSWASIWCWARYVLIYDYERRFRGVVHSGGGGYYL